MEWGLHHMLTQVSSVDRWEEGERRGGRRGTGRGEMGREKGRDEGREEGRLLSSSSILLFASSMPVSLPPLPCCRVWLCCQVSEIRSIEREAVESGLTFAGFAVSGGGREIDAMDWQLCIRIQDGCHHGNVDPPPPPRAKCRPFV